MGHRRHSTNDGYGHFAPDFLAEAKACADTVLGELEALCELSPYRDMLVVSSQVTGKFGLRRFDPLEVGEPIARHPMGGKRLKA